MKTPITRKKQRKLSRIRRKRRGIIALLCHKNSDFGRIYTGNHTLYSSASITYEPL